MEITKHQKNSSLIGPRASFGLACLDAKKQFQDLTVFTADTYTSAGLLRFKKKFPEDVIEVSIAEQVLVSSSCTPQWGKSLLLLCSIYNYAGL